MSATYDPFTLMTMHVSEGSVQTDFEYDGKKERVLKTVTSGNAKTTTLYLRGMNDYALTEKTGTSQTVSDRFYVYGPTGVIAMQEGTSTFFVVKDYLGSTRVVLNSSNAPMTWNDYTPYGYRWGATVSKDIAYKFTGQEFDTELGLHNFRARMYDDSLWLFYVLDPGHQGYSPYGYVGGNPVMRVDPTGRAWWLTALEVIKDIYEVYSAASMVYNTGLAIQSGDLGNIIQAGMHDAFSLASMGAAGTEPEQFHLGDWVEHAGVSSLQSVAGYYANGGKTLRGALGSFGEGVGFAAVNMGIEYGEINEAALPFSVPTDVPPLKSVQYPERSSKELMLSTLGTNSVAKKFYENRRYLMTTAGGESGANVIETAQWMYVILNRSAHDKASIIDVVTKPGLFNGLYNNTGQSILKGGGGGRRELALKAYIGVISGTISNQIGSSYNAGNIPDWNGSSRTFSSTRALYQLQQFTGAYVGINIAPQLSVRFIGASVFFNNPYLR